MCAKNEDEDTIIFPTIHKFNGNTKQFMKIVNSESNAKAYEKMVKELGCKPQELAEKLRHRAWKGKSPSDILAEAAKD